MKPEVRIIQSQEVTTSSTNIDLSNSEIYALMAKYGINNPNQIQQQAQQPYDPYKELTFDELVALEEQKIKNASQQREMERLKELSKPTPYSFDRNSIRHYDSQFKSIDDSGFGVEIKVVSNMPIDKGYGY